MTVTAATKWNSNADMMLDVVELGYIRPTDRVIDLTFGRGKWWTKYEHPGGFIACVETHAQLDAFFDGTTKTNDAWPWFAPGLRVLPDFRDLRVATNNYEEQFDVVVFDPPYVSMGGRATSGLPDFMDRFGLENAATTPELLQQDNNRGLAEAYRICKPGGLVLAKCAPYISSGVRKEGDWWTRDAALELGFAVEDMLIHLGDVRAQPKTDKCPKCKGEPELRIYEQGELVGVETCPHCEGEGSVPRRQKHARNNFSVCFVLRKPRAKRTRKVMKP